MATHAHTTSAPAVQHGFSQCHPVPRPDLTPETLAMLDAIGAERDHALPPEVDSTAETTGQTRGIISTVEIIHGAPLPSLATALSRRRALFGALAVSVTPTAALAAPAGLAAADARLVELSAAYVALDRIVNATASTDPKLEELIDGFGPIEDEMSDTAAVSMVGILAKARMFETRCFREIDDGEMRASIADDLLRLHAEGGVHV